MTTSPMARLQTKKQAAVTTGSAGSTGIPCAMVLRLIRVLPGVPGLLALLWQIVDFVELYGIPESIFQ